MSPERRFSRIRSAVVCWVEVENSRKSYSSMGRSHPFLSLKGASDVRVASSRSNKSSGGRSWHSIRAFEPNRSLLKRMEGWCDWDAAQQHLSFSLSQTQLELRYHHLRSQDPRKQRAAEDDGSLFTYQSLKAGQYFSGEVVGPEQLVNQITGLLPDGGRIALGRSRSAEYGAAELSWVGQTVINDGRLWEPADAANDDDSEEYEAEPVAAAYHRFAVVLRTPLAARNKAGSPAAVFPVRQLCQALGLAALSEPTTVLARTEWQSGFLSHLSMPRSQTPCVSAG